MTGPVYRARGWVDDFPGEIVTARTDLLAPWGTGTGYVIDEQRTQDPLPAGFVPCLADWGEGNWTARDLRPTAVATAIVG